MNKWKNLLADLMKHRGRFERLVPEDIIKRIDDEFKKDEEQKDTDPYSLTEYREPRVQQRPTVDSLPSPK